MQINEVFKILDGRIRMVDNIGLMEEGITTSGLHSSLSRFFAGTGRTNGTESRKVTAYAEESPASLSWSLDGKMIQFEQGERFWEVSASGEGRIHFWESGRLRETSVADIGRPTATSSYFIVANQIWALDMRHRLPGISPVKPVQLTSPPIQWGWLVSGRDARKIFAVGSSLRGELIRYDPATKRFSPFLEGISAEFLEYSPDGKSILYVSYPDGILWKANRDGSSRVQLAEAGYYPETPRWSPDGTQVCFTSNLPKAAGYVVSTEGGSPRRILPEGVQAELTWSPNGKRILYIHFGDTPQEQNLSILDLANGRVEVVPGSVGFFSPRWSRDGRYIVATTPNPSAIRIFDFQTQQWRVLPVEGDSGWPAFSRDGQSILFFKRSGRVFGIYRMSLNGGPAQLVADLSDWHLTGKFGF